MNDEELKKYLKDNFTNYIRESIDSSIIFKYISEIETENNKLNNIIDKAIEYLLNNKLYTFKYDDEELFEITTDKKAKDELLKILGGEEWIKKV